MAALTADGPAADPEAVRSALAERHRAPVELRQTHISWVFLVGDRAYKLKKPVVLPFLDYGSPAARRRMCELEVELNRRLAPDLYLGVIDVVPRAGRLGLHPPGEPGAIDHLVEMMRFQEADTLAARIASGAPRDDELAAVGRLLARFHGSAPVVRRQGAAASVRREFGSNVAELVGLLEGDDQTDLRRRILRVAISAQALLESRLGELVDRAARGMVRDCHGDLRAEHVILGDPPQVVDCVEFDPGLRAIDVADDLAFLVMDLWTSGGGDAAAGIVSAYRSTGGDCGDDTLLALYGVHRALVRAKVALIACGEMEAPHAQSGERARAERLLSVAERCSWRARPPMAIIVCGVPASGKSRLARELARASGLPLVSSDETRKELAGVGPAERAGAEAYGAAANTATYGRIGELARSQMLRHGGVILDGTFRHRADRRAFTDAFASAGPTLFVECRAPREVLEQRARRRDALGDDVSDADLAVVRRELATWEPLDEVAADDHVLLRSDRPVQALAASVVAALDLRLLSSVAAFY